MIKMEKSTTFIGIKSLRVPYVDIFLWPFDMLLLAS
jgi:hypothetical protein